MAAYPSILAQRIPWAVVPGGLYSPQGCKESDTTEATQHTHTYLHPQEMLVIPHLSKFPEDGAQLPAYLICAVSHWQAILTTDSCVDYKL